MQAAVELSVAGAGEAMAGDIAGGGCDGCSVGVGGERVGGAEPMDSTDAGHDLGGVEDSDAAEFGQGGSR